jgi:hypothetical protein
MSTLAVASSFLEGSRVTTLIAPAIEFLPKSVPWGPRRNSTRSMSKVSRLKAAPRPM